MTTKKKVTDTLLDTLAMVRFGLERLPDDLHDYVYEVHGSPQKAAKALKVDGVTLWRIINKKSVPKHAVLTKLAAAIAKGER